MRIIDDHIIISNFISNQELNWLIIIFLLFPNFYRDQKQILYQLNLKHLCLEEEVIPNFALLQSSMKQSVKQVFISLTKIIPQSTASLIAIYVVSDLMDRSYLLSNLKIRPRFLLHSKPFMFILRTKGLVIYFRAQKMLLAIIQLCFLPLSYPIRLVLTVLN